MTGTDPRINTPMDSTSISGRMTDRAIELIGMLNKVIGADGLGTNTFTLNGDLGEQTLSIHTIERDITDPLWKEKETVYFGTSHDRLDLIQSKLAENLDNIKNDIASNVTGLFDIISSKENEIGEDDGMSINDYEQLVQDAQNAQELKRAEANLQAKITRVLTSDDTLNEMINAFFENIELTIARMDSEIFDLLNDYDNNYSNGSTDANAQKFLVTLPNRPGQTGTRASDILNSIDEVLNLVLQEDKEINEERNGPGTYTQADENSFIQSQVLGNFSTGNLTLSDDMIDAIIIDLGLSDSQLDQIDSMDDFLKLINQDKLISLAESVYGTTGNEEATLRKLFKDHLKITTPKYYEDQRSLFDILNGKAGVDDISNENVIFNSIGDQIKRVSSAAIDLFGNGYEQVTDTNLQNTIRRNPLSAVKYLEDQKANLSGEELDEVQSLIDNFIDKQAQAIEFMIDQEGKKEPYNKALVKELEKVLKLVDKYNGDTSKITDFISAGSTELQELFGESPEIDSNAVQLSSFKGILNEAISLPNVHKALYGNEMRESSTINAQYDARKLPDFKQDGSPPEDTSIAPPNIGPTPLAGVLAKIGDVLMQKAYNLEKDAEVPTEEWMDENVQMLETINNQLPDLGMSTAGEAFIESLRENFKDIIRDFFTTNLPKQEAKDTARAELNDILDAKKSNKLLGHNDPNVDLADYSINANLNSISNALNGDITSSSNFINQVGLKDAKKYLEDQIDILDDVDYTQAISDKQDQISSLNTQLQDLINNGAAQSEIDALNAQITQLANQISNLNRDENNLLTAQDLLNRSDGIKDRKKHHQDKVDKVNRNNHGGHEINQYLEEEIALKTESLKNAIQDYSDSMTDFSRDTDGDGISDIVQTFKDSLDEANLDLDGNGENDFVDIAGIIDKVGGLSNKIKNIYGGNEAVQGGIEDQSIRRLILLMFVFSMLEAGEWDYRRYEADTTRYQVT